MTGTTIQGYQIKRKLGEGGMAEVYYAENRLGLPAAVKVLKPELSAVESLRLRFDQEAHVMAKLSHPNIRRVLDITEHEGRPVILMEYLSGQDLGAYVRENGALKPEMGAQLWEQAVSALQYAHSEGVIHRDVKPSNFFLTDEGVLKLLDFGIAKAADQLVQTMTGQQMGTVLYMSPEQIKDPKRVTKATDYYSLGVTFYHLLTGEPPYDVTTESSFTIQLKIVQEELDLSCVPTTWRRTLAAALRKEPEARSIGGAQQQPVRSTPFIPAAEDTIVDVQGGFIPNPSVGFPEAIQELERNMVVVEGGIFIMGCTEEQGIDCRDAEKPAHEVELDRYRIGKYPVTQAQWKVVMGNNPSYFKECPECPVEQVSWDDIQVFIQKLNQLTNSLYRLPTEAEWEYAARGGRKSRRYIYSGSNTLGSVGWSIENSSKKTYPVGGKSTNELGLFDMSGNVWEWCADYYDIDYYYKSPVKNPNGPAEGLQRVARGGSWSISRRYCRTTFRFSYRPEFKFNGLGFRLVSN